MHPKLKAFMRTEAMECDMATTQAPPSDTGGSAIENASEPQEMAATVAATPTEADQGATQARLPEESPQPVQQSDVAAAQGETPKLRRTRSRNSKKGSEESGGQPLDDDCDTDDELQWCSKGIAVFLSAEEEGERTGAGESMEVDSSSKPESACPEEQESQPLHQRSKSMMACFRPKNKTSPVPSQAYPLSSLSNNTTSSCMPPTVAVSVRNPLLPVTLASKSTPPPSIPHTFTPSNDIDMDTGESTVFPKEKPVIEESRFSRCRPVIKTEERSDSEHCPANSQSSSNGCLIGSTPIYAHNPFTLLGSLPLIVKTEPGLSTPSLTHPRNSPIAGQTFVNRVSSQSGVFPDYFSPIASLPRCMPLEDLMRLNFVPLSSIKQEQNPRLLALHSRPSHVFYQKPELASKMSSGANMAKLFTCQQCGATFKHRHHVVRHMRAHTGEKPFRCEECGAMFARKCILTNHIRTHTGEKPYVCGECGDAFSRKHHLVIHRRTHTGEKPYVCSVCATAFARSHHLNRHLKTHILMQQGHLSAMTMRPEGAVDLSLQHKMPEHVGVVDLSVQKTCAGEAMPTTQVFETGTDYPQSIQVGERASAQT